MEKYLLNIFLIGPIYSWLVKDWIEKTWHQELDDVMGLENDFYELHRDSRL